MAKKANRDQYVGKHDCILYRAPAERVEARKKAAVDKRRVRVVKRTGLNVSAFNESRKPSPKGVKS